MDMHAERALTSEKKGCLAAFFCFGSLTCTESKFTIFYKSYKRMQPQWGMHCLVALMQFLSVHILFSGVDCPH